MTGKECAQIRVSLGMTQFELAEQLGVTVTTISNWETGRSSPAARFQKALQFLKPLDEPMGVAPFRPVQYLGSKMRLVSDIGNQMNELAQGNGLYADLYAGSGVVTHHLAQNNNVLAVDTQHYSASILRALLSSEQTEFGNKSLDRLENAFRTISSKLSAALEDLIGAESLAFAKANSGTSKLLSTIIEEGSIEASLYRRVKSKVVRSAIDSSLRRLNRLDPNKRFTIVRYFGGAYFSYQQAIDLEALSVAISQQSSSRQRALRGVLLSVASSIACTVGKQFAQPLRLMKSDGTATAVLLKRALRDRQSDIWTEYQTWASRWSHATSSRLANSSNIVHQGDAAKTIATCEQKIAAAYADPPYTIDHYSRFYHVLDTISRQDAPGIQLTGDGKPLRGLYRPDRYQSPFCIPSQVSGAFESLFHEISLKRIPLLLSYSDFEADSKERPRLMTKRDLLALASKYFKNVGMIDAQPHAHRKLNSQRVNTTAKKSAEYFVICKP